MLTVCVVRCSMAAEALKDAFSDLDYGGNSAIRAHDLGTALRAIGQTPTEADIHELLQDAMLDGRRLTRYDTIRYGRRALKSSKVCVHLYSAV